MFKGRHFDKSVILLCVRWYLAYNLSLRNLKEMMAERGIGMDHSTVHRWMLHFSPNLLERFHFRKRQVTRKWNLDETYVNLLPTDHPGGGELSTFFGREISRDLIGRLRSVGFITSSPKEPATGRALHLCDDEEVPVAVRHGKAVGFAGRRSKMPVCSARKSCTQATCRWQVPILGRTTMCRRMSRSRKDYDESHAGGSGTGEEHAVRPVSKAFR